MQLAALSEQEMRETEGAAWQAYAGRILIGGTAGFVTSAWNQYHANRGWNNFSWRQPLGAAAIGAGFGGASRWLANRGWF